ncbi:hypothetical protein FBR02_00805 [Anaerolineae bacterium CFX9]|nr:hypothetical protein [Anaerolineae bacterium CFX9]
MTVIEVVEQQPEITQRQRWSHYFALLYGLLAIIIGINLRDSAINSTVPYTNLQVGIRAQYPRGWVIDDEGSYVFRVRDMSQTGFKTTIQVSVITVTAGTSARNILDSLILNRQQLLAYYRVLSRFPTTLTRPQEDIDATVMTYTFVSGEDNPFLESLPVVVEGQDVLILQRGQAIVISFLSDRDTYEQNLPIFERFLNDIQF